MGYSIERYHDISCGHRVHGHESKCAHLHGHNYRVTFVCAPDQRAAQRQRSFIGSTAKTSLDNIGRVIDFSVVKERLCMWLENNWDHKFLVATDDPVMELLLMADPAGVVTLPFNPTAENMAAYLVEVVGPEQLRNTGVRLVSVHVEETRKCSAMYESEVH